MTPDRYSQGRGGILSRGGPAIAVIGLHVLIVYGLIVSMGIVEMPKFAAPVEAIFIDDPVTSEPEPELKVKPEIEEIPVAEVPQLPVDVPIVPPTDVPVMPSESAITGTPADSGAVTQELKTSNRVEPVYPAASRRAGEEGTVRLKVLVDERGRPQTVEIVKASGFARLDEAAVQAVRKWRFQAANNGSGPVSAWTQVNVTFKLTATQSAQARP